MIRKIIHVDMDAFYASVEQRDNPSLRGKPIAVGGLNNRSVLSTASYEARKFGVHSAMPTLTALSKCPNLIVVPPRFEAYKQASEIIRSIFFDYTDWVEPLSLDEAYLDVTFQKRGEHSATLIAKEIKQRIFEETGLTASAGVSNSKFMAKIASDFNKPDGLFVIPPEMVLNFVEELEIDKFFGIGKVTADRLHKMNINTGADLKLLSLDRLTHLFGKSGQFYFNVVRGNDSREVIPFHERKSIGAETTFDTDFTDKMTLKGKLFEVIDRVWKRIEKHNAKGKTVTLKVKYFDFEVISRSRTSTNFILSKTDFTELVIDLFENELELIKAVRLLGVTLSNFGNEDQSSSQLTLEI